MNFLAGKPKPFKPIITYAAVWEPTNGLIHIDNIFPHIAYGFRNRTIPIAIYNVSAMSLMIQFFVLIISFSARIHLGKSLPTMMLVK